MWIVGQDGVWSEFSFALHWTGRESIALVRTLLARWLTVVVKLLPHFTRVAISWWRTDGRGREGD